jgi:hypothetical protein
VKNNIIELTTLSFSHHDQIKFAEFSGDKNPIHINQTIAKSTIAGECIVYGINLILTALEFHLTNSNLLPTVCRVRFLHPVIVGKPIRLVSNKDKGELRWETNIATPYCIIKIENQQKSWEQIKDAPLSEMKILFEPKETSMESLKVGAIIPSIYGGTAKIGKALFPNLCILIGLARVYEIAILSNFVGMQVPGLNSLFSECSLKLQKLSNSSKPHFELINYDKRFKLLKAKYIGTHIDADIAAFERPFYAPKSILEIKKIIPQDLNLSGLRMLVVGGSNGIGASVCRVASYLGCDVSFTYKHSKEDSFLIIDDVKENCKSNINAFELDVASLPSIQTLDLDYDILCYFPSEKIFGKVGSFFDIQRFEDFYKIYCVAFNEIARRFLQGGGKKIYYPSSVAVMSSVRGLEEYAYAKKIGEEICKSLEAEFDAEIICERLERIETRQTLSVMPTAARDPVDVAIDICSKFSL